MGTATVGRLILRQQMCSQCNRLNDCLSTRFVYDGANAVVELSAEGGTAYGGNVSNEVVWAWIHGPGLDQPVERIGFINGTARNRQVVHADGLGSIAALTDESGEPVQTYAYAAFGGIREQTGTDLNRVTFTAREALGDSLGFYYYRNRIYDPNTGRFTSEDPGITEEQAVEVGKMAKEYTKNALKNGFSVRTRWQGVFGGQQAIRKYGIVSTKEGDLAELLVSNGLARIHGMGIGGKTWEEVEILKALEAEAKEAKRGAWGL